MITPFDSKPCTFSYVIIFIACTLGLGIMDMITINKSVAQSLFDGTQVVAPQFFTAKRIFNSGNIATDADIKNLIINIPEKNLIGSTFLPTDATVVEGTQVLWVNGQNGTVHGIEIEDATGKIIYSNSSLKFTNTTSFSFDKEGTYTYFDPSNPDDSGTIQVISKDKSFNYMATNITTPTVGLFVVPKVYKQFWDARLNSSIFHIIDSYEFKNINLLTFADAEKERALYLYSVNLKEKSPLIKQLINQISFLEEQLSRR